MKRWDRDKRILPETVLTLTLKNRKFQSVSFLTAGPSLEYEHRRSLEFDGCFYPNTWLVVDKFEIPPNESIPWHCWINSNQLRLPKIDVFITEQCIDSSIAPQEGLFFTLVYEGETIYSDITYPERMHTGLVVEPEMFNELLNADLSQVSLTVSLWLSDQFESFCEWAERAGEVIGWDVTQSNAIHLDKYSVSINTKVSDTKP